MPAPDKAALLEAVVREVAELERLSAALERSLVAGDWNGGANALRDSRRVTHAFSNAMDAAADVRDEAFDQTVHARMRRVFDLREDQVARLRVFHDNVGERLKTMSRFKEFAQSVGAKRGRKPSAGLDRIG